ncbi:hypothetical protein HDU76_012909 [Blyttiomyces sp. JEL0837]|nr:hypothetical protein HDU76_012909 [Blyttiomyces sp. JEL0837]
MKRSTPSNGPPTPSTPSKAPKLKTPYTRVSTVAPTDEQVTTPAKRGRKTKITSSASVSVDKDESSKVGTKSRKPSIKTAHVIQESEDGGDDEEVEDVHDVDVKTVDHSAFYSKYKDSAAYTPQPTILILGGGDKHISICPTSHMSLPVRVLVDSLRSVCLATPTKDFIRPCCYPNNSLQYSLLPPMGTGSSYTLTCNNAACTFFSCFEVHQSTKFQSFNKKYLVNVKFTSESELRKIVAVMHWGYTNYITTDHLTFGDIVPETYVYQNSIPIFTWATRDVKSGMDDPKQPLVYDLNHLSADELRQYDFSKPDDGHVSEVQELNANDIVLISFKLKLSVRTAPKNKKIAGWQFLMEPSIFRISEYSANKDYSNTSAQFTVTSSTNVLDFLDM